MVGSSEMPREARVVLLAIIGFVLALVNYRSVLRRVFAKKPDHSMAFVLVLRFGDFHDSVIRRVEVTYPSEPYRIHVRVVLSTQDLDTEAEQWVNVQFDVEDVAEFAFHEQRRTTVVVVYALEISFENGEAYLDFDSPNPGDSCFMVAGKRCRWSVLPYSEK